MKRIISRAAIIAAATACALGAVAGSASADPAQFLTDLGYGGYPQRQATQDSAIKLGYAICDELATGKDHVDVMLELEHGPGSGDGWSSNKAAAWVAAATDGLCPQYR